VFTTARLYVLFFVCKTKQKLLTLKEKMEQKYIVVSGYFDPLHIGHLEYFERAKRCGSKLVVIVNNELQSKLKHGSFFMPVRERIKIIRSIEMVDFVMESIDTDRSVCKTLRALHPYAFCNGGDQTNSNIPEALICNTLGIKLIDGLGGKIQSSSWLLKKSMV
jgi:cytidyltransferase-like protein